MDFERLNIDNGFLNLAKSEKKKCEEIKIHNPLNDLEYVQLSNGGGFIARIQKSDKKADGFATNNPIYKIIFEKYGPSGKLSFKFESIEGELLIFYISCKLTREFSSFNADYHRVIVSFKDDKFEFLKQSYDKNFKPKEYKRKSLILTGYDLELFKKFVGKIVGCNIKEYKHIFQTNFVLVESIKGNPLNSLRNTLEKAYPYKEL
jgi:hypothetical protein